MNINPCATFTSLILTKPHPIFGNDAGNQPPAPDPSRLGGVLSAARLVECTRPQTLVMGLPCAFVIGLLAFAIRPRPPVIGADVRQIREPRSGETANAFHAQGPDGPFLQDLGPVFERRGAHAAPQTIPLRVEQRSPLDLTLRGHNFAVLSSSTIYS